MFCNKAHVAYFNVPTSDFAREVFRPENSGVCRKHVKGHRRWSGKIETCISLATICCCTINIVVFVGVEHIADEIQNYYKNWLQRVKRLEHPRTCRMTLD